MISREDVRLTLTYMNVLQQHHQGGASYSQVINIQNQDDTNLSDGR
jgi:hypothetical protein